MKTKITLILILALMSLYGVGQVIIDKECVKDTATNIYSLEQDKKVENNLITAKQIKLNGKVDITKIGKNLYSTDEQTRLNAVDILRYFPTNPYIQKLEEMLLNDISNEVKYHCAKALHCLNSTNSISVLINALKTDDDQLKMEIALALAALGEKTECFKTLEYLGKSGERNIILNTHLGYLDLGTNEAIEKLKSDLSDSNSYISVDAAIILAELGYFKEAYSVLKSKLTDEDKYIRMAALRGLAYIGTDNAIELIKEKLDDTEMLVSDRASLILKNCNISFKPKSSSKGGTKSGYNPAAAASYAEQWCGSFNTASYANYSPDDCANFVSQCLMAGGMNLSNGPGLDSYGCIISCDNLNTNFTTYQGCSKSSNTYSGHLTSGYPSWFVQGDVALFGEDASSPSDPWQHATLDVVTGTPILDAHTNPHCSSESKHVSYFYPSTGSGFTTGDFYHFNSTGTNTVMCGNDDCNGAVTLTSNGSSHSCSVDNATADGFAVPSCDLYTPQANILGAGVFFNFIAQSTSHTITVTPTGTLDAIIVVYSGGCYNLQEILGGCMDTPGGNGVITKLTVNNLTIGQTYTIRVYDYGSTNATSGGFNISVTHNISSCTNPSVTVNDISGTSPVTMTCNASGGSGGNYAYKWYNGTSCSGTILGTTSTLNVTTSGYYTCKVYINGFETTCYSNDYGYATITTTSCTYSLSQTSQNFSYGGGSGSFTINATAGAGCNWNVSLSPTTEYDLANITSISNGTGPYTITYTIDPNITNHSLSCTLTVTGNNGYTQDYVITQDPNPTCNPMPSTTSATFTKDGGSGSFNINVGAGCFWNIYNSCSSMLTNITPISGNGPATVTYNVLSNPDLSSRSCWIYIQQNNLSHKITQEGNPSVVNEVTLSDKIKVFPNPTNDKFTIAFDNSKENYKIEILNITGQVVFNKQLTNSVEQVDLYGQSAGVYFVKLQTKNNTVVKKIIKQN